MGWTNSVQPSGVVCASSFWSSLTGSSELALTKEDKKLLKAIFNPELSDRRADGDRFIPPDASFSYVQRLQSLVREEDKVKQRRRAHFYSVDFVTDDVGPLFPSSWTSKIGITGRVPQKVPRRSSRAQHLKARPE